MNKKQDRRVARTKAALKQALLTCVAQTNELKKISILDIVNEANYNRTTFYAHYEDKYELLDEMMDDAIAGFAKAFRAPYQANETFFLSRLPAASIKIFDYVKREHLLFTQLLTNPIFSAFPKKFVDAIATLFLNEIVCVHLDTTKINLTLYVYTSAYSLVGLITHWVESGFHYPIAYMNEQLLLISTVDKEAFQTFVAQEA